MPRNIEGLGVRSALLFKRHGEIGYRLETAPLNNIGLAEPGISVIPVNTPHAYFGMNIGPRASADRPRVAIYVFRVIVNLLISPAGLPQWLKFAGFS